MLLHNQSLERHHSPVSPIWYEFEMNNPEAEPFVDPTLVMDTHTLLQRVCVCVCWPLSPECVGRYTIANSCVDTSHPNAVILIPFISAFNKWVVVTAGAERHTCITDKYALTCHLATIRGAIWCHLSHHLEVLWINMYINMTLPLSGRIQCFTLHTVCKHTKRNRLLCSSKQAG